MCTWCGNSIWGQWSLFPFCNRPVSLQMSFCLVGLMMLSSAALTVFSPLPCFLGLSSGEHLGDPSFSPHCSCQNLNPASGFSDLLRVEINICQEECILISVASSPGENRSKTNLQTHRLNASVLVQLFSKSLRTEKNPLVVRQG